MIEYRYKLIEPEDYGGDATTYPAHKGDDPRIWLELAPIPQKARLERRLVFTVRLPWLPGRWHSR